MIFLLEEKQTYQDEDFVFIENWGKDGYALLMKEPDETAMIVFDGLTESLAIDFKKRMDMAIQWKTNIELIKYWRSSF